MTVALGLPVEVSEAAALALGHHWPQVDEDALSSASAAYGDTARRLSAAAGDADRHTQNVLTASKGGLAQGFRAAADRLFGTESSHVATTATHCTTLAESLAADAGAVRQTKLAMATELCALTETLAALRAAGGGAAQLHIPQAVAATSRVIASHHERLVRSLTDTVPAARTSPATPTASVLPAGVLDRPGGARADEENVLAQVRHTVIPGTAAAGSVVPVVRDPAAEVTGTVTQVGAITVPQVSDVVGGALGQHGGAAGLQHPVVPAPGWVNPSSVGDGAGPQLGPTVEASAAHPSPPPFQPPQPVPAGAPAGQGYASPSAPIQHVPDHIPPAGSDSAAGNGHIQPPAHVASQWATVPPGALPPAVPGLSTVAAAPEVDAPAPLTPRAADGLAPWAGGHAPAALPPPPLAAGAAPGPVSGAAPVAGPVAPQPVAPSAGTPPPPATTGRPLLGPGVPPPSFGMSPGPRAAPDVPVRADAPVMHPALAFPAVLVAGFAPGLAPRRCVNPARQLPLPQPFVEPRPGLCCPVADHPLHALLPDPVQLAIPDAKRGRPTSATTLSGSGLLEGYDPLGGLPERQLERRFVIRRPTAELPGEYAWPPCEIHPEGSADGYLRTPELLTPGTELDLLGPTRGRVLALGGTPLTQRSVPAEYSERPLLRLTVQTDLPVWKVQIAGWFGQPGGGIRYRLTHPVTELVAAGVLTQAEQGIGDG